VLAHGRTKVSGSPVTASCSSSDFYAGDGSSTQRALEHEVGRLDRDIGAGADRNSNVRLTKLMPLGSVKLQV
jgi:hypothetical protein